MDVYKIESDSRSTHDTVERSNQEKLIGLLNKIGNEVDIVLNGVKQVNARITNDEFSTKTVQTCDSKTLSRSLGFTLTQNNDKIDEKNQELVSFFEKLWVVKEMSVQNDRAFNDSLYGNDCLFMNDTHSSHSCYMSPTDDNNYEANVDSKSTEDPFRITKSGMPDGTSQLFPMFVELKGTAALPYEGIIQGIDRIRACANMYTIYKRFIVFCPGRDENDSWIVILNNDISAEKHRNSLHICKVSDMYLMVEVMKQVSAKVLGDSNYVFNTDAAFIVEVLLKLGINWVDCKIELTNKSSSNVYLITFGNGNVIYGKSPCFVVKVNRDKDRYEAEIKSLSIISDYIINNNVKYNFYAIGAYSSVDKKVQIFDEKKDNFSINKYNIINNKKGSKSCWYLNGEFHTLVKPEDQKFAGAIIMNKGINNNLIKNSIVISITISQE